MQKSNTIWVIISNFRVASFSGRSRLPTVSLPKWFQGPFHSMGSLDARKGEAGVVGGWEGFVCVYV